MPNITFYDCTPMMADVFSGTHKRPEPIGADALASITGDPPTLLYKRINEFGAVVVMAERGESPLFFPQKSAELREWHEGAPILLAGGRWLIAPNDDATSAVVMDVTSTTERSAWIEAQAWHIVTSTGVDFTVPTQLLPLAKKLVAATGVSLDKGKQHIAKALRRLRGEYVAIAQRGGKQPGSGRPRKDGKVSE